jgi:hypothetical protein
VVVDMRRRDPIEFHVKKVSAGAKFGRAATHNQLEDTAGAGYAADDENASQAMRMRVIRRGRRCGRAGRGGRKKRKKKTNGGDVVTGVEGEEWDGGDEDCGGGAVEMGW